ncbi:hypothetical protein BHM03_00045620 [Ensete ventricosum]|nr:hypothetical protein BHM03_00045620 [Ensete ventricosum]
MPTEQWKTERFDVVGHGHKMVIAGATEWVCDGKGGVAFPNPAAIPTVGSPPSRPLLSPFLDPIFLTSLEPRSFNLPREISDAHQQPPEAPTRWYLAVAPRHGLEPSPEALGTHAPLLLLGSSS